MNTQKDVEIVINLAAGLATFLLAIHSLYFGFYNESGWLTALFITLCVYLPHELGHMIFGKRGFVFDPLLAIVSLIACYFRIPFILVGYSEAEDLPSIVAGPLMNIILAFSGAVISLWDARAQIFILPNLMYALSNLLPFPPLDGFFILEKKRVLWFVMFVPILLLYLTI